VALQTGRTSELPSPRPRKALPHRRTTMLVLEHGGEVLLEKRPAPGIWGGLWCFPVLDTGEEAEAFCRRRFGLQVGPAERLPEIEHGFTHFTLTISPQRLAVIHRACAVHETGHVWLTHTQVREVGIPAPVQRILALVSSDA
jgi:A/G-specific adenine glycosylase